MRSDHPEGPDGVDNPLDQSGQSGQSGQPGAGGPGGQQPQRPPWDPYPWDAPPPGPTSGAMSSIGPISSRISDLPRLPEETLRPPNRPQYGGFSAPNARPAARSSNPAAPAAPATSNAPSNAVPWNMPPQTAPVPAAAPAPFTGSMPTMPRLVAPSIPLAAPPETPQEEVSLPTPRETSTLTAQIRSIQPPDVARQAISELNLLADELVALTGELEASGLARIHSAAYFESIHQYIALARQAWLSAASERLEQDGSSPEYRQRAIALAHVVTRLRRECEVVTANSQFPLPQRKPWRWRRRARLITRALRAWQTHLSAPPDPRRLGIALFELRATLSTALAGGLELTLLDTLVNMARWFTPLVAIASALSLASATLAGEPNHAAGYSVATLLTLMGWLALLLLTGRTQATLSGLLASACFSESRSTCNGAEGSRFLSGALRVWWVTVGVAATPLTLAALVVGALLAIHSPQAGALAQTLQQGGLAALTHLTPATGLSLTGVLLAQAFIPPTLVASAGIVALAIPALLLSALRFAGEMSGMRRWVAPARRYAIAPALAILGWLTGALVAVTWLLSERAGLDGVTLARFTPHDAAFTLTATFIPFALALALPWLALIEIPFRIGLTRWRHAWLRDLLARKEATESHVRRLSAPNPQTGAQDTSDETLRAMQYDLVLIQFYTTRIDEARKASSAPLSLTGSLFLILFIIAAALLLDLGAAAFVQALTAAIGL